MGLATSRLGLDEPVRARIATPAGERGVGNPNNRKVGRHPPADAGVFSATAESDYAEVWIPHTTFTGGCGHTGADQYIEPAPGVITHLAFNL